jgi:hypothetical protein
MSHNQESESNLVSCDAVEIMDSGQLELVVKSTTLLGIIFHALPGKLPSLFAFIKLILVSM